VQQTDLRRSLLRRCRKRPQHRRAAKQPDDIPTSQGCSPAFEDALMLRSRSLPLKAPHARCVPERDRTSKGGWAHIAAATKFCRSALTVDTEQDQQQSPTMNPLSILMLTTIACATLSTQVAAQPQTAVRGERLFRACVACHSLEPNRNMTGPSLADLWNRQAGGLPSFDRYSPALKSSGIIWQDNSLDAWLADPQHFIPGNTMTFPGMKDAQQRAELLAFLKEATQPGHHARTAQPDVQMGGMMGMMGGQSVPNLKSLGLDERVEKITHCRDTYRVTTADGKMHAFWERNLRFKTDVSDDGPTKGAPAIVSAGMMGDRADVIFAAPDEISAFISQQC